MKKMCRTITKAGSGSEVQIITIRYGNYILVISYVCNNFSFDRWIYIPSIKKNALEQNKKNTTRTSADLGDDIEML